MPEHVSSRKREREGERKGERGRDGEKERTDVTRIEKEKRALPRNYRGT